MTGSNVASRHRPTTISSSRSLRPTRARHVPAPGGQYREVHLPYLVEYSSLGQADARPGWADRRERPVDRRSRACVLRRVADWINKDYFYPNMNAYKIEYVFPFWLGGQARSSLADRGSSQRPTAGTVRRSTSSSQLRHRKSRTPWPPVRSRPGLFVLSPRGRSIHLNFSDSPGRSRRGDRIVMFLLAAGGGFVYVRQMIRARSLLRWSPLPPSGFGSPRAARSRLS